MRQDLRACTFSLRPDPLSGLRPCRDGLLGMIKLWDCTSLEERRAKACHSVHECYLGNSGADGDHGIPASITVREGGTQIGDTLGTGVDQTGLYIWGASLVLGRWIVANTEMHSEFVDRRVIEVGAGCGVAGLAVAKYTGASHVTLTDFQSAVLAQLRHNVHENFDSIGRCATEVRFLDWYAAAATVSTTVSAACSQATPEDTCTLPSPSHVAIGADLLQIFSMTMKTSHQPLHGFSATWSCQAAYLYTFTL